MKKLKNKRGFSLVELMVVVAIMGTLAAIAIPAYNEYRKSAKKTAYRTDLMSLHKGWLAFGVELDSFCDRETSPQVVSIENVGMSSLRNSKLYGGQVTAAVDHSCANGSLTPATCQATPGQAGTQCTGCSTGNAADFAAGTPAQGSGGPNKHNFIGFGSLSAACTTAGVTALGTQILGRQGTVVTTQDTGCDLGVTEYEMGVYGHLSGVQGYGVSISEDGVFSNEWENTLVAAANASCT